MTQNTTFYKDGILTNVNMTVNASSSASNATPAPTNAPSPGLSQLYIDLTTLFFSLIILAGLFGNSLADGDSDSLAEDADTMQSSDCKYLRCWLGSLRLRSALEDHWKLPRLDLRRCNVLYSDSTSRCLRSRPCHHAYRDRVGEASRQRLAIQAEDDAKAS